MTARMILFMCAGELATCTATPVPNAYLAPSDRKGVPCYLACS